MTMHLPAWLPQAGSWAEGIALVVAAHLPPLPPRFNLLSAAIRLLEGPQKGTSDVNTKKALQYVGGFIALGELAVELAADQMSGSATADQKIQEESIAIEAKGAAVLEAFGVPSSIATELTSPEVVGLAAQAVALGEKIAAAIAGAHAENPPQAA